MSSSLKALTAFERHKRLLREYEVYYGQKPPTEEERITATKTDFDTLKEHYRFIRTEEDDKDGQPWEIALARKYYSRLYREYAVVDLSRYKEGKIGCRWRTHTEVVAGKGQFSCGAKGCPKTEALETYEVPFKYAEAGKQKHALVKARLCQEHGMQLNYSKNKDAFEQQAKKKRSKKPAADMTLQASEEPHVPSTKRQKRRDDEGNQQGPASIQRNNGDAKDIEAEVDKFLNDLLL